MLEYYLLKKTPKHQATKTPELHKEKDVQSHLIDYSKSLHLQHGTWIPMWMGTSGISRQDMWTLMTIDTLTLNSNVVMDWSPCGMMLKADASVILTCFYQNFPDNINLVQFKWYFCLLSVTAYPTTQGWGACWCLSQLCWGKGQSTPWTSPVYHKAGIRT